MGKARAAKGDGDRRARIAAQRAADQRARRRNRLLLAGGAVVAVVAVVLALVLVQSGNGGSPGTAAGGPGPTGASLATLTGKVTSVPAAALDQVGSGTVTATPTSISGAPLTSGGKPEMLYMGAEYCPYCAAERWSMIVALSRFGTFNGLTTTRSADRDGAGTAEPFPSTATWTFANASYTSKYLTFTPVEEFTNIPDKSTGGYTPLMTPTAEQQALIQKYDAANQGAIPFIDYGNRYMSVGASYDPGLLAGLTWSDIAADLHNPSSPVAKGALGAANYMTAAVCSLTGNQPASACTPAVRALQAKI
jgi:thiol-disulfide isomerase/thioredoxin